MLGIILVSLGPSVKEFPGGHEEEECWKGAGIDSTMIRGARGSADTAEMARPPRFSFCQFELGDVARWSIAGHTTRRFPLISVFHVFDGFFSPGSHVVGPPRARTK